MFRSEGRVGRRPRRRGPVLMPFVDLVFRLKPISEVVPVFMAPVEPQLVRSLGDLFFQADFGVRVKNWRGASTACWNRGVTESFCRFLGLRLRLLRLLTGVRLMKKQMTCKPAAPVLHPNSNVGLKEQIAQRAYELWMYRAINRE